MAARVRLQDEVAVDQVEPWDHAASRAVNHRWVATEHELMIPVVNPKMLGPTLGFFTRWCAHVLAIQQQLNQ